MPQKRLLWMGSGVPGLTRREALRFNICIKGIIVPFTLNHQAYRLNSKLRVTSQSKMVTGVETAGLVLGAIPLIISALENYENLAAPTKAFIHWKRHLRKLILELYTIHTSYDQAVRLLLQPFTDLEDQTTMMEDPRSKLWREGDVAESLRDQLGPAYGPLILTIDEVSDILVEIAACLNIPGSQQV